MATTKTTKSTSAGASATATKRKRAASGSASRARQRTSGSTRRSGAGARDALTLLKNDHDDVEQLFKSFEKLGEGAAKRRRQVVDKVIEALSAHAAIEEQVFYPHVRRSIPDATPEVLESLEEHHIVKWTLSELEDMDPTDERFGAKVTVLIESVRHHVKEEENELFPKVRKALSREELAELGSSLAAAKTAAPTRPHPRVPDTPPGNVLAQALTAPVDAAARLRDKVREIIK
jgi:hemerythrin-like domain-containing protein